MSIREVVADGIIQQYDVPRPRKYWQRNRKQTVNYVYDTPFATDRQLEDQRLLQDKNRNPRFFVPTKQEKVRSEVFNQKQGQSRSVAVKANVLNKIVREASGVYNYTIVAPPKAKSGPDAGEEKIDPETHPLMAPYAKEAKSKPIIVSFGHRPRSASRTFHPASMRFKLKHSEVVKTRGEQSGFGLPVAVLSKVLIAPKILSESEILEQLDAEEKSQMDSKSDLADPNNLFFTAEEDKAIFGSTGSEAGDSWISSIEMRQAKKNKKNVMLQPIRDSNKSDPIRPSWDEAFHRIKISNKERLALKENAILKGEILPLKERCTRFALRSVVDPPEIYCSEKQDLDAQVRSGIVLKVPKAVPQKPEYPIWYDPYTEGLDEVKEMHRGLKKEKARKLQVWKYQEELHVIPKSDYFPTSVLAKMRAKSMASFQLKTSTSSSSGECEEEEKRAGIDTDTGGDAENAPNRNFNNGTVPVVRIIADPVDTGLHLYHSAHRTKSDSEISSHLLANRSSSDDTLPVDVAASPENGSASDSYSPSKPKSKGQSVQAQYLDDTGEWKAFERDLKNAVKAAKRGDRSALYNFTMKDAPTASSPWNKTI